MIQKTIILCMLTLSSIMAQSQASPESGPAPERDNNLIAFTSDTQAPMWVETIILKANKNRTATRMVFNDILQGSASSLFILGDVVNLGYSNRQWKPVDKHIEKLRNNNVKVNAVLGNHEVMGRAKKGQQKFQSRFPNHIHTGYVEITDSVAIVMLNSNFKQMTETDNAKQLDWYKSTLEKLDADSSVHYIITGCHHSPFTNSKIVGPSTAVQQKFVPPFLKSKKSRLFLSGHCHGFEHYKVEGKDFLVIGGGGGLNQPLKKNGTHRDHAESYKPMFHYLTVRRNCDGLQVTSYQLKKDFSLFEQGLALNIPLEMGKPELVASHLK
ncbi:MAG: metallophosphoesterase family protein [Flavisolibacter sp.]